MNQSPAATGTRPSLALWAILGALLLGVVVLAFAVAEVGVRVLLTQKHGTAAPVEQFYAFDERTALPVPVANLRKGRIETNSLGFRGPEIRVPKPPGTLRLAFLGASTTWCAEVSGNDKVWPHLVTEDLRRALPKVDIDYVNSGVPGYTAKSSLKNFEVRVAPLQPDIVVIYHATNDMSFELRRLAADRGIARKAQPDPPSWLSRHSRLWDLAEKNLRIWFAQRKVEANRDRLDVEAATLGELFRKDLTALVLAAKQSAKLVAIATFSTRLRREQSDDELLDAASSALYYMPFMTPRGLLDSYDRYNEIIRDVANATGALLIDGERDVPGDALHFTDSVHFSDAGSRAMADRVFRQLVPKIDFAALR